MILSNNYLDSVRALYPRIPRAPEESGAKFGALIHGFEICAVAGAMSYANARHAKPGHSAYMVLGVPVDLTLGMLLVAMAMTGRLGDHASHGMAIAEGFLTAYAARLAVEWGEAAKQNAMPVFASSEHAPPRALGPIPTMQTQASGLVARYPWAA